MDNQLTEQLAYYFIFNHAVAFRDFFIPRGWGKKVEYKTRYYQMPPALSKTKVLKTGRGIGKSLDIEFSLLQMALLKPNEETVLSSFRRVHIKDRCESIIRYCLQEPYLHRFIHWRRINRTPIYSISFVNGHTIYGASVGDDPNATAIIGKHPSTRAVDEMQVFPKAAWIQFNEARAESGSDDIYVGVPNGIIGMPFTDIQKNPSFRTCFFRMSRKVNPFWDQERKKEALVRYGGEDADDYKQQIMGEDGNPCQSAWDIEKIAKQMHGKVPCYTSTITPQEYISKRPDEALYDLPIISGEVMLGIDAGYTEPTVILIFEVGDRFILRGRVNLENKVIFDDQEEIVDYIMDFYSATAGVDVTSADGREIVDALRNPKGKYTGKDYETRITDVYFNKKVTKGFTEEGQPIEEEVKIYTTLILTKMFADMKFLLPKDEDILKEFSQEVKVKTPAGRVVFRSTTTDHIISAFRCFALAKWMQTAPQYKQTVEYAMPEWGPGALYGSR